MDVIIALVFISLTLVIAGLVFFFSRLVEGDFEHGERLSLLDATPAVVDEVPFDDGPPWPVTPDGLGPSLELIDGRNVRISDGLRRSSLEQGLKDLARGLRLL